MCSCLVVSTFVLFRGVGKHTVWVSPPGPLRGFSRNGPGRLPARLGRLGDEGSSPHARAAGEAVGFLALGFIPCRPYPPSRECA